MKCIVQHNKKNPDRSDTKKKCSLCPDFSVMQSAPIHSSALIFQRLAGGDGTLLSNGLMHVGNVVRK